MGGTPSKPEVIANSKIADASTSTGFHLIELHIPTMGYGAIFIVAIVLLLACCAGCYRRFLRRWGRRPPRAAPPAYAFHSPSNHPATALASLFARSYPAISYRDTLASSRADPRLQEIDDALPTPPPASPPPVPRAPAPIFSGSRPKTSRSRPATDTPEHV